MNNAPKLDIKIRIGTAFVALAATFAVMHSVNALSAHYVNEGATTEMATSSLAIAPKA